MAGSLRPIDPRGPRFNQAVVCVALLVAFALGWRPIAPIMAFVLFLGAAFGPRYGPFLRLYADVVRPRLRPPSELEDPRPPRFAAAVGVVFLLGATIAFAAGSGVVGWGLALIVAALAGLAAVTGICVGCEAYLLLARARATRGTPALIPEDLRGGNEKTWVVFTTPYCASCGPVVDALRARAREAPVVTIDAVERADVTVAFAVRAAPTAILADADGRELTRLVGPKAVDRYLAVASANDGSPASFSDSTRRSDGSTAIGQSIPSSGSRA